VGVVRGLALSALLIAFFVLGLTAGLFVDGLEQSREEYTLAEIESPGLLPYDRLSREDVKVFSDSIQIDLPGARWASFSATGSMLPVLGQTAHALQITPRAPEDIHLGDIVSFWHDGRVISHRVISIGKDDRGTYYVTKGDNNPDPDPVLVRFEQIDRVVVAILY